MYLAAVSRNECSLAGRVYRLLCDVHTLWRSFLLSDAICLAIISGTIDQTVSHTASRGSDVSSKGRGSNEAVRIK